MKNARGISWVAIQNAMIKHALVLQNVFPNWQILYNNVKYTEILCKNVENKNIRATSNLGFGKIEGISSFHPYSDPITTFINF